MLGGGAAGLEASGRVHAVRVTGTAARAEGRRGTGLVLEPRGNHRRRDGDRRRRRRPRLRAPGDHRLAGASRLLARGNPAPLAVDRPAAGDLDRSEPLEDLAGETRAADADGDGVARRGVGAFERQPTATPVPAGNVLANPDGEAAGPPGSVRRAPIVVRSERVAPRRRARR